jgi:ribose transport system ATP-binding protein
MMVSTVLSIRGLSKKYPGTDAVKSISLDFYAGKIHAITGKNGCGKTTLAKMLSGVIVQDDGQIFINEKPVILSSVRKAEKLGIVLIHQDSSLVHDLTVWENVFLGHEIISHKPFPYLERHKMQQVAANILKGLPLELDIFKKAKDLSLGEKHIVQLARAIVIDPKIIIIDELSSAFADSDLQTIYKILDGFRAINKCVIYFSYNVGEVFNISDTLSIMKDGTIVTSKNTLDIYRQDAVHLMLGKDIKEHYPKLPADVGPEILRVYNLNTDLLQQVGFSLHKGEILGIVGLAGSGRTHLARALLGLEKRSSGRFFITGNEVCINRPIDAIHHGIAYISETRNINALFNHLSIVDNVSICALDRFISKKYIHVDREKNSVKQLLQSMGMKNIKVDQEVSHLSGGNQQKVILARWYLSQSKIFIFDEPTRGIDVQGKVEIYNLFNEIIKRGGAIIMISSDISEIIGMSNRIIVMRKGQLICEFSREEAAQERIFHYASNGLDNILRHHI